ESTVALNESTPELATARPYAVDLTGWFEGYTHPGTIDANGGSSRVAPGIGGGPGRDGAVHPLPAVAHPDPPRLPRLRRAGRRDRHRRQQPHQLPGGPRHRPGRPLPGLDGARRDLLPGERVPV